jgi:hypothetical protein
MQSVQDMIMPEYKKEKTYINKGMTLNLILK